MTGPRTIIAPTEWKAVTDPQPCQCGHEHYGRAPGGSAAWAPQWQYCEDPDCGCTYLRTDLWAASPVGAS